MYDCIIFIHTLAHERLPSPPHHPQRAGFETGPLPWEERAANEPPLQMESAEDPILIPEEEPEFYEAVDPLPESEVPDLEETGIPLPPERSEEGTAPAAETVNPEELEPDAPEAEAEAEVVQNSKVTSEDMEQNRLAEQLLNNVQGMVDPNATLEQQLSQMRLQLAALAQLPGVIQQTLELVSKQLMQLTETKVETKVETKTVEEVEVIQKTETVQEVSEQTEVSQTQEQINQTQEKTTRTQEQSQAKEEVQEMSAEEVEVKRRQDEEQRQSEKEKKEQEELERLDHESRQVKHHPTPRAGKPKPAFGPLVPQERPIVLTGGRKWRKPKDAYNEQFFTETLAAQAELIQGNTKGINFMKYEKPPISLDHLKDSDVYKMIHNMEQVPMRRTDLLTPVVAECDYREKCRSISPCVRGSGGCDMP